MLSINWYIPQKSPWRCNLDLVFCIVYFYRYLLLHSFLCLELSRYGVNLCSLSTSQRENLSKMLLIEMKVYLLCHWHVYNYIYHKSYFILSFNYIIFVIIQMDKLRCTICRKNTQQFSILSCDHLVCPECLWGEITTTLQGNNSFKCTCGQITYCLNRKSNPQSAQITAVGSPRPLSINQSTISVHSSAISTPKTKKI